ncbi:hypothetical protein BDI4_660007 [Burkholderia diffusa]|uniref:hypothetical protein n=1 Tax=Burkholderia diffusa TaxID=488732 RepID=UPI001CAB549C|nr:hypothetical protein [Burkholderia diffusa]CAG9260850.1 hypothetical protein BDI4_660007 [Burkholderia diffusa]
MEYSARPVCRRLKHCGGALAASTVPSGDVLHRESKLSTVVLNQIRRVAWSVEMKCAEADDILYEFFGTKNPIWILKNDSDAIKFYDSSSNYRHGAIVDYAQLMAVRSIDSDLERVRVGLSVNGARLIVYLTGKKTGAGEWRGIVSSDANFNPAGSMMAAVDLL